VASPELDSAAVWVVPHSSVAALAAQDSVGLGTLAAGLAAVGVADMAGADAGMVGAAGDWVLVLDWD
jgi:hypothetical protein